MKGMPGLSGKALFIRRRFRSLLRNRRGVRPSEYLRTAQVTTAMMRIGMTVVSTKASAFQIVTYLVRL